MSTIKADAIEAATGTDTDLVLTGKGTGVPDIETGFKVSGTAGLPLSDLRAGTAGNLITYDASGDPAAVATGTATHVLTSNGAGAAPTFQAVAGGGMTTLSDQTVSSATSVTFSSLIDGSTYHKHELWITDITGVTSDWELDFQYESGGSFQTSSYIYQWSRMYNSSANYAGSSSASAMRLCRIRGNGASVRLRLDDANDASYKSVTCFSNWNDSPNIYSGYATGSWLGGTGAITGIKATITAGSFSARCRLMGYK
jgi:hypothetical protein